MLPLLVSFIHSRSEVSRLKALDTQIKAIPSVPSQNPFMEASSAETSKAFMSWPYSWSLARIFTEHFSAGTARGRFAEETGRQSELCWEKAATIKEEATVSAPWLTPKTQSLILTCQRGVAL